ncbi:amino acid transporter [Heterobasidion irregulare TC 32-1]|uniref:Amino acid transporter n=1 Tax=Heterobasidion irregulare (strain TC 32-1) TaxID=747525 RepID=W4K0C9_HETIT|nr:amino acid transporter [Heterobasidion irregulare TC 32-1]ETW79194.1 amino acid transporter [Heterobasidion irregulare TC 32-1]
MVQSYSATEDVREVERVEGTGESEGSTLLGGTVSRGVSERPVEKRQGHATLMSSASNLANTIIGSGMLTFPLAMASAGIIPGMITCIFSGSVAAFGLYLLSACARKAPHRRASFFAVANLTFPRAAVFFDAAIAIKCFGVSISYLIIIKSLLPNVVASLYHDLTSPDTNPPAWALDGRNWITLLMVILVPLAFLRRLDSLRHTSYIALFSVAYLVVIVIVCYFHPVEGTPAPGEIHLIKFTPNFVSTFPIQVFAFTCAQNLFPIFNEVVTNSQHRMNIIIGSSIGSATLTYEIIALFGYLTFGSNVGANIIAMYPSTSLFIAVGQLAIAILVMFSYPLQVHPCRNCLDKVFHFGAVPVEVKRVGDDEEPYEDEDEHDAGDMTPLKHTVLTAAIIASGFTIAYFVDDLQMVLSFVGATGSTTISFILPGLFYWKMTRDDADSSRLLNCAALALAVYGTFILVFCLSFNIYQVVHPAATGKLAH